MRFVSFLVSFLMAFGLASCNAETLSCNGKPTLDVLKSEFLNKLSHAPFYPYWFDIKRSNIKVSGFTKVDSTDNQIKCIAQMSFDISPNAGGERAIANHATISGDILRAKNTLAIERAVTYLVRQTDDGRVFATYGEGGP